MTVYITTFGGSEQGKNRHNESFGIHRDYTAESKRLFESAKQAGITNTIYHDNDWLKSTKEYQNSKVFLEPSFGWAFKPVSIWYALQELDFGDSLVWTDTNHIVMRDLTPLADHAKEHNIYTHRHHPNYPNMMWTHKDMFVGMGCDEEHYWLSQNLQVNVICFYKNKFVMDFVTQWKDFACDYDVMIANRLENFPCFREHRHEQSIFSLLVEKYNIPYVPDTYYYIMEKDGIDTGGN